MSKEMCYWCGKPATSREHVPPKNLFPAGKNQNLITVPSCPAHNQDFSAFDEKFRVFIQARESSADALREFSTRTFRGLKRPQSSSFIKALADGAVRVKIGDKETLALRVDPIEQSSYFEKIIRGLYFHLYRKSATGRVVSISKDFIVPGFDYEALQRTIGPYLNDPKITQDGATSNPDIFRFKYARQEENGREAFAIALQFYSGVEVIGLITPMT